MKCKKKYQGLHIRETKYIIKKLFFLVNLCCDQNLTGRVEGYKIDRVNRGRSLYCKGVVVKIVSMFCVQQVPSKVGK